MKLIIDISYSSQREKIYGKFDNVTSGTAILSIEGISKGKVMNFYITLNELTDEMHPSSCRTLVLSLIRISTPGRTTD
jgi:hypothetical protein